MMRIKSNYRGMVIFVRDGDMSPQAARAGLPEGSTSLACLAMVFDDEATALAVADLFGDGWEIEEVEEKEP